MPSCKFIGVKLRKLRRASKMSQKTVAEKLNVNRSTISLYENGKIIPPLKQITALAQLYRVSYEALMDDTPFIISRINDTTTVTHTITEQELIIAFRSFSNEQKSLLSQIVIKIKSLRDIIDP